MSDPHADCDVSVEQVYRNGECIGSKVKCDTHNVVISDSSK